MLAKQWLNNARSVMDKIEATQMENITKAATLMADSIEKGRWVHTFGCGHATLPIEEMYPRIGGFVGFHPIVELPLTFFTNITGQMGVDQFIFLERVEGYGREIMKSHNFDTRDTMWLFSHTGVNEVNIDIALEAKDKGMKVVVFGSAAEAKGKTTKHSCGKTLFELADLVVDTCAPSEDASVPLKNHIDKVGPVSTMAFVTAVWMTVTTVAEILADRGVQLHIHPSHNVPGDSTSKQRLADALGEYKRRLTTS
ncbi:sugar isomerase domain-containing protein [Flagellimonas myxillae]|uniref:sugar isomerase domain-containing protein n=1 Tax=Flagellimonas myxillae TaxID=2942214 RepID=UPI00201F123D|nr:sugar isomerase domain-containing protein [Muricauda myxillae]MCL6268071.1 sugar isomerase domain-containing protein [Muricauda myxillae]